ncbi:hypothetical protein [Gordonia sp. VNK21]|uniref:hypothetical protein n=1 Tax=Gordonia sp. VNK21 TaxID=3382483 RepID=UPI0038D47783
MQHAVVALQRGQVRGVRCTPAQRSGGDFAGLGDVLGVRRIEPVRAEADQDVVAGVLATTHQQLQPLGRVDSASRGFGAEIVASA